MSDPSAQPRSTPADYPNHLEHPRPYRAAIAPRPLLLAALVLLCFAARAGMASKTRIVCPDATRYIAAAKALNEGHFQAAFHEIHLNSYPIVLAGLDRLGLDLETAGRWYGAVIASLVVLPLFGWARRQFDDRVALLACVLYAAHTKFIEWSPEIIRDQTFWFLLMLSIYLLWRAVVEVRLGWFMAAGAAGTLASLTRFEGLFLLIPLVCWAAWRWSALREGRARLVWGVVLCLVAFPAMLALANFVWLHQHANWEVPRLEPLGLARQWLRSLFASASDAGVWQLEAKMSLGRMFVVFVRTLERGLTAIPALLMLGGIWRWRHLWSRRDHQPLFYFALAVMAGMWIHLWSAQESSTRYPLTIFLLGSVFAALGLLGLSEWLASLARRLHPGAALQRGALVAPLVFVAVIGPLEALSGDYADRQRDARLGRWAVEQFGPAPRLVGHRGLTVIANYYAHGRCTLLADRAGVGRIVEVVLDVRPDVVILSKRRLGPDAQPMLLRRMAAVGFKQVGDGRLPPGCERVLVLVRADRK